MVEEEVQKVIKMKEVMLSKMGKANLEEMELKIQHFMGKKEIGMPKMEQNIKEEMEEEAKIGIIIVVKVEEMDIMVGVEEETETTKQRAEEAEAPIIVMQLIVKSVILIIMSHILV